jgi:hypothetical protein
MVWSVGRSVGRSGFVLFGLGSILGVWCVVWSGQPVDRSVGRSVDWLVDYFHVVTELQMYLLTQTQKSKEI